MVKVKIENAYSDGHESERVATVADPAGMDDVTLDGWWEDVVWDETGDGHGVGRRLGSCCTATVIEADVPGLVGQSREWAAY